MAISLTVNGVAFSYPQTGDENWGDGATQWAQAVTSGMLQRAGGAFVLTSEVDFGANFGLKSLYLKSRATNPAAAGLVRLGNTESVAWRNAGNTADLSLSVNSSNELNFGGARLTLSGAIVNADIAAGAAIAYSKLNLAGSIVNSDVASGAAIAYSKLSLTGTLVNADISSSAAIAYSKLALADSVVNTDIAAGAAIAYSKLALSNSIVNADIATGAAIAYSKLNLSGSIVNADVGASAAIAYSKLALSGSIVNADISTSAAIARSKVASGTASHVVINDGSGNLSSEAQLAISRGGTGQSTASGAINALVPSQAGNNGKFLTSDGSAVSWGDVPANPTTTKGDLAGYSTTQARVPVGSNGQVLMADSAVALGLKWANLPSPTVQRFTSGSGTYTTPTGVRWIRVRMVGGGGGGAGGSSTGAANNSATAGGATTFGTSLLTANGGGGGGYAASPAGGTVVVNSPAVALVAVQGSSGAGGMRDVIYPIPGVGGGGFFNGGGSASIGSVGGAAIANTGGGGGGGAGSSGSATGTSSGTGAGAGGYIDAIIVSPSATYSYSVGTGGAASAVIGSGLAAGAGASGIIIVEEYY